MSTNEHVATQTLSSSAPQKGKVASDKKDKKRKAASTKAPSSARTTQAGSKKPRPAKKIVHPCPVQPMDMDISCTTVPFPDTERWKSKLGADGYVVLTGVLTPAEGQQLRDEWATALRLINPALDMSDPTTLTKKNLPGIASVGIFKDPACGIGHSRLMYLTRQKLTKVFAAFYATKELQTSFDGASLFPDWSHPELKSSKTKPAWIHTDQESSEFRCVQGMCQLLETTPATGGFVVVPGSHLVHATVRATTTRKGNYLPVDYGHPDIIGIMQERGLALVTAPANSVVLWDSRVLHSNHPALTPIPAAPEAGLALLRLNQYVTMTPRRTDAATLAARLEMVDKHLLGNHWTYRDGKRGPMKAEHLAYPRHRSFNALGSAALPVEEIRSQYSEML